MQPNRFVARGDLRREVRYPQRGCSDVTVRREDRSADRAEQPPALARDRAGRSGPLFLGETRRGAAGG